jgi:hypothetical protein
MTFLQSLSATDLQTLTFPRRELPGKLLAFALALLLPKPQPEAPVTATELQPKFKIGDLIAEDWVGEFDEDFVDFGEILGARFLPEGNSCYPEGGWLYYVRWTHTTCGLDHLYPCYDGEPTRECDLRLVKRLGGQK